MNRQDLINEAAKQFIKELDGKEFTVEHFRKIIFGNCNNMLKSAAREFAFRDFVIHPSVQIHGVGMNGVVMDKFIKDASEETKMWESRTMEEISK